MAHDPETDSIELLVAAGARRGFACDALDVHDPELLTHASQWCFALARTIGPGEALLVAPVAAHTVLVPGLEAVFSRDKWVSYHRLTAAGVPTPPIRLLTEDNAADLLSTWGAVVAKPRDRYGGEGVTLCRDLDALRAARREGAELAQQFVPGAFGRDHRIVVIDDEVVLRIARRAEPGEFRSNVKLGGRAELAETNEARDALARHAATASGLAVCGVDIVDSSDPGQPFVVCEVNTTPGFGAGALTEEAMSHMADAWIGAGLRRSAASR